MIFAVDFDNTLCKRGQPNMILINSMRKAQADGNQVILHTSRTGALLQQAVEWCAGYGLRFNAVYGGKPVADYYIDDKAVKP